MKMVRLKYSEKPNLIHRICDLIRPLGDQVESESEEVLTLHVAADGTIARLVPPPRCKLDGGIKGSNLFGKEDDKPIDLFE